MDSFPASFALPQPVTTQRTQVAEQEVQAALFSPLTSILGRPVESAPATGLPIPQLGLPPTPDCSPILPNGLNAVDHFFKSTQSFGKSLSRHGKLVPGKAEQTRASAALHVQSGGVAKARRQPSPRPASKDAFDSQLSTALLLLTSAGHHNVLQHRASRSEDGNAKTSSLAAALAQVSLSKQTGELPSPKQPLPKTKAGTSCAQAPECHGHALRCQQSSPHLRSQTRLPLSHATRVQSAPRRWSPRTA
jgi:hypothetical protein